MRTIYFTLIIIALSFSTSCKKNEIQYHFNGKVTNQLDNSAVNDATVNLGQRKVQNGGTSPDFYQAASVNTSQSGVYDITIDREMVSAFEFEVKKENFFDMVFERTTASITTDGVNSIDIELEPKSWVEFDIENLFPEDDDHFRLFTIGFKENCAGCASNAGQNYYGDLDTVIRYVTTAGKYVKFTYINVNSGESTTDSVFTTPFETITYPIVY
ncbi:hypothetical protein [Crocinitomix algicola]|uniref:hypothetical protein n=1 Tax=Crocinitomix algicola TaxID=1740263 RepID=UPI000872CAA7|nr:hypothetical protein [Crocinitomix algicola]